MKLLLIDLLNIGDLLLITPAIRMLRDAHPSAEIHLLVGSHAEPVVRNNPFVDRVISLEKNGRHKGFAGFLKLVRSIRSERYDKVIDLHGNARTTAFTALSGAREKCGFHSKKFKMFYSRPLEIVETMHRADAYAEALRQLGLVSGETGRLEMHIDAQSQENADKLWRDAGLEGCDCVIGLNPGASVAIKRWVSERWSEVADALAADGARCVIFGGPGDVRLVEKIVEQSSSKPVSFAAKTSLIELAALSNKCRVFATTDTGPMHIAAAMGVPTAAIFSASNPEKFEPYKTPSIVCKTEKPCAACKEKSREADQHTCMTDISVDMVLDAVRNLKNPAKENGIR